MIEQASESEGFPSTLEVGAKALEGPARPTVDEVCVIQGPGRGECWGCPVRDCVLWQNPMNPLSPETQAVALRTAQQLASRQTAISPWTELAQEDVVDVAGVLALQIGDPEVQKALLVQMAAEAVLQGTVRAQVIKRQNQYTDRWMKGLNRRMPTQDDDANLDRLLQQAEADAAAEVYECNAEAVLHQLLYFRGKRIVQRGRSHD